MKPYFKPQAQQKSVNGNYNPNWNKQGKQKMQSKYKLPKHGCFRISPNPQFIGDLMPLQDWLKFKKGFKALRSSILSDFTDETQPISPFVLEEKMKQILHITQQSKGSDDYRTYIDFLTVVRRLCFEILKNTNNTHYKYLQLCRKDKEKYQKRIEKLRADNNGKYILVRPVPNKYKLPFGISKSHEEAEKQRIEKEKERNKNGSIKNQEKKQLQDTSKSILNQGLPTFNE